MGILVGYVLGSKLQRLLHSFWEEQAVVPKVGGLYARPFRIDRGVNQGGPIFPTVFNILVDAVVRVILMEACEPQ